MGNESTGMVEKAKQYREVHEKAMDGQQWFILLFCDHSEITNLGNDY